MRCYADTSFLVKLLVGEPGSDAAAAEYRRLKLPVIFYLPLHALEVENALRQKAFHLRRSLPARSRGDIARNNMVTFSRLELMLKRKRLVEVAADWDQAILRARTLSQKYTESLGARSLDLLHVAFAIDLECELFFSTDDCQSRVARAEGLKVIAISDSNEET